MAEQPVDPRLIAEMKVLSARLQEARRHELFWRVVLFTGIAIVLLFGNTLRHQQNDIVASRTEARSGSCQQDNVRIDQHNDLVDATEAGRQATEAVQVEIDTILAGSAIPRPGETAEQAAAREHFVEVAAQQKATVDTALSKAKSSIAGTKVPPRDCSPEGIDAYYSQPPTTSTGG